MRTFARKPKTTRRAAYAESREPPRVHPAQGADLSSILRLQRTIGNHNVQRLYPNDTEALNSLSVPTANTRFIQGISRMPVSSSASRIPKSMLEGSASSNALKRIQKAAQYGLSGSAKPLPHLETIQSSFGRHSLSEVKAFVAGPAGNANRRLGSTAYTTGESVAFKQSPDLRVAAHEAAHVVQQRSGMPIRDVLGNSADPKRSGRRSKRGCSWTFG
jgi:hypothetical protein